MPHIQTDINIRIHSKKKMKIKSPNPTWLSSSLSLSRFCPWKLFHSIISHKSISQICSIFFFFLFCNIPPLTFFYHSKQRTNILIVTKIDKISKQKRRRIKKTINIFYFQKQTFFDLFFPHRNNRNFYTHTQWTNLIN